MQARELDLASADGTRLFGRVWAPDERPRGAVLIIHGYAEHSGRYAWTAEQLAARGYAVLGFDLRGHGRSQGEAVYIRSANEYLDDVDAALACLRQEFPGLPVFLLGHSMGGGVLALYAVARLPREGISTTVRGLIFSGAVLPVRGLAGNFLLRVMVLLARVFPKLRLQQLAAAAVSRDPAVVADYESDPLNYHGRMPVALVSALVRASRFIEKHMAEIWIPLLILHGSDDALASPEGSRRLYEAAASSDKMLKIYEGLFHEVLNEPERDLVIEDIAAWMDRLAARPSADPAAALQ